jgi:hypothetical protein
MSESSYLSIQASIICVLLALIGSTAIVEHPEWFGAGDLDASQASPLDVPIE